MSSKLSSRQWVPYDFEMVRDLFKDPNNLAELTPPSYNASIETDGPTAEGTQVIITSTPPPSPFPIKWLSAIKDVEETESRFKFVDIQVSGPFGSWTHTHVIEKGFNEVTGRSGKEVRNDKPGTWVIDDVIYDMPMGIFGRIAEKLFARKQLEDMFAYRKDALLKILERESSET